MDKWCLGIGWVSNIMWSCAVIHQAQIKIKHLFTTDMMASTPQLAVPPDTVGYGVPTLQTDDVEFIHIPILAEAFGRRCELNEDADQVEKSLLIL